MFSYFPKNNPTRFISQSKSKIFTAIFSSDYSNFIMSHILFGSSNVYRNFDAAISQVCF